MYGSSESSKVKESDFPVLLVAETLAGVLRGNSTDAGRKGDIKRSGFAALGSKLFAAPLLGPSVAGGGDLGRGGARREHGGCGRPEHPRVSHGQVGRHRQRKPSWQPLRCAS